MKNIPIKLMAVYSTKYQENVASYFTSACCGLYGRPQEYQLEY
jgi:hypothetical protein